MALTQTLLTWLFIKNSITSSKNADRINGRIYGNLPVDTLRGGTNLRAGECNKLAVRFRVSLLLVTLLFSPFAATGERLPVKTYTTEEGLLRNLVRQILPDSNGYLWL